MSDTCPWCHGTEHTDCPAGRGLICAACGSRWPDTRPLPPTPRARGRRAWVILSGGYHYRTYLDKGAARKEAARRRALNLANGYSPASVTLLPVRLRPVGTPWRPGTWASEAVWERS